MISARHATSVACAVVAIAAAGAGLVARRTQEGAQRGAAQKFEALTITARGAVSEQIETPLRNLESEVKRAAAVPQLRAALADGVDSATLIDLFDSEDWWAPFRSRAAGVVSGTRLLGAHGDKDLPVPGATMLARARESGLASGMVAGARLALEAVAPIGVPRGDEATFLVFGAAFDVAGLQSAIGAPVLVSDGQSALAAGGTPAAVADLRASVGREKVGAVVDARWRAVAVPISLPPDGARLWLWVWQAAPGRAPGPAPAVLWAAACGFALAALAVFIGLFSGGAQRRTPAGPSASTDLPASGTQAQPVAPTTGATTGRQGRGTLSYDTDELGVRPRGLPDSGHLLRAAGGGTPRSAAAVSSFVAERAPVRPGNDNFGRYRLIDRLGEGGMAEIYTAVLHGVEGFRRVYVLKRLRPEVARNRSAVDQFIDEAKLGSSLVHSNVVPVFDFGKVGDEYFMAQEYIIGRDMIRLTERHVERFGRGLDERVVLYVAHEVLEALAYAHNLVDSTGRPLGLVHRDVSPGNVMLTSRGEVKLADFGIVKAEGRLSTTDVGVVKGNVSFMSPEQARGQSVDGRSDLFSLGLVVYYCLTGQALYPGSGTFDQLMRAAAGPATEHLQILENLSPNVARILGRALAVAPGSRYQSAAEFAAELAPLVLGAKGDAAVLMQQLFGEDLRREAAI